MEKTAFEKYGSLLWKILAALIAVLSCLVLFLNAKDGTGSLSGTAGPVGNEYLAGQLHHSFFQLICCVLILISIAVFVMMDSVRLYAGWRTRGLFRLAFFGLSAFIYGFIGTGLLSVYYGHTAFFETLGELCFIWMPFLLMTYYVSVMHKRFHLRMQGLLWMNTISALMQIIFYLAAPGRLHGTESVMLILLLISVGVVILTLFEWHGRQKNYKRIYWESGALICLALSCALRTVGRGHLLLSILGIALFMQIMALTQFYAITMEYKMMLDRNARQMESQNAKLMLARTEAEGARHEAVIANEAKKDFLSEMSHEIRTPVNAVLGMDEMILRECHDPVIREYAEDIYHAGRTLQSLVNDILDLSAMESGELQLTMTEYELCSLIRDLEKIIRPRTEKKGLDFQVLIDGDLPVRLSGDELRLRQILRNLLTNAVKYTETGTVFFRVSGTWDGEDEILHVEVEDTGIGIDEADLNRLFEAFEKAGELKNRDTEGSGMGLRITCELLSLMGSTLRAKSEPGKGSVFFFDVRQKIADDLPVGNYRRRAELLSRRMAADRDFRASDAKILVADDNSMNRKVFRQLLKSTGIRIDEAEDGAEALDMLTKEKYDLIFLDHMMPKMDGVETLHRIRDMKDYPSEGAPVYVLTANVVPGAREEYLKEGFDGFLAKPVDSGKLLSLLHAVLPGDMITGEIDSASGQESTEEGGGIDVAEYPSVDGLDWNFAVLHLPDEELLQETLKDFHELIPIHGDKLQKMYEELPSGEAMTSYRIQVHGMKSSAATVGIVPLAGMANVLEYAARDGDEDTIRAMHDVFLRNWFSYKAKLTGIFGIGENEENKEEITDISVILAYLTVLKNSMEELDVDEADQTMKELEKYRFSEEGEAVLIELASAVKDLDSDGAVELADKLENVLKAGGKV